MVTLQGQARPSEPASKGGRHGPKTSGIETILTIANFLEVDPNDFGQIVSQRRHQVVALRSSRAQRGRRRGPE